MKEKTALLMIDVINKMDFNGGENLFMNAKKMIKPLLLLKSEAKAINIPIIYVNDNFGLWHQDMNSLIEECKKGIAKEIIEQFIPEKDDFFIIKPKHSGFFGTQLDILLKQLNISNLILTGISGDMCVLFTASDAYMREYNLWVPSDCLASETYEDNQAALRLINRSMFANIDPSSKTNITQTFQ